ncbi:MAG: uncharacterized protein H6Q78_774 [Candidatus Krumholzibacteriota bacterium]|nr:uncharacterized protein [Candidatus Krumholzibacteriota bacterium]
MINDPGSNPHYDAVIAGAGPAGSSCAVLLGRAGFRVLLCDRASFPRSKICGETVNPACWDAFEALGVAGEVERRIQNRIIVVSVTNQKGSEVRVESRARDGRCFFSMGRDVLDDILVRAAGESGAEFRDGTAVTGIAWEGRWRIDVRDQESGRTSSVTAEYLVGADGRNSTVAGRLGPRKRVMAKGAGRAAGAERVGVQWHSALRPELAGVLCMYLFDSGYCGLVAADANHTNAAMVTTPDLAATATADFREFLRKTLWSNPAAAARFGDLEPLGKITKTSPINPRRNRFDDPHAILIGDAHETVEPFTGEGVRYALEDGMAAARRLIGERAGVHEGRVGTKSRFRVNRIFSPTLRHPAIGGRLISLGAGFPWIARKVAGTVISRRAGASK